MKDLAARHPQTEHLLISLPCQFITDLSENPFKKFAKLKSLSLKLGLRMRCGKTNHKDPRPVGAVLDQLQLESLELIGLDARKLDPDQDPDDMTRPRVECLIPGHITTPNLIKRLVHLRVDYVQRIEVQHIEYLLFHCRRLERVHFDEVAIYDEDDDTNYDAPENYPPIITDHHHMSPFLRSASYGFVWVSCVLKRLSLKCDYGPPFPLFSSLVPSFVHVVFYFLSSVHLSNKAGYTAISCGRVGRGIQLQSTPQVPHSHA